MSSDPIDRLGARLFEAARQERHPQDAEQRALAGARRAWATSEARPLRWVRWSLALAAAALVTALVVVLMRSPTIAITAEPASDLRPARGEQRREPDNVSTVLPPPEM